MTSSSAVNRARRLRRRQTDAERKLWMRLRAKQIGSKFRRQEPIGSYVADFCCMESKLILELDGSQHEDGEETDQRRTAFFEKLGYRVLRFWDHDVLKDVETVLQRIEEVIGSSHPDPLPGGEGTLARNTSLNLQSQSEDDTRAFGSRLADMLTGGELIGLHGELGSGKTVFVRGLAEGLHVPPRKVRSPTFTLVNEYSGGRLPLYHIDLYRVAASDMDRMALRDYFFGHGVCVVEWFERLGEDLPHLDIDFTFVGETQRDLVVTACGTRYDALLLRLQGR